MQNYLIVTVSAIIFLTFCQIILPVNSMKNISKMVIGIVFVTVLALPIIDLLNGKNNFNYKITFDENYYYYLDEIENSTLRFDVENVLKKYGYNDYEISIIEDENLKTVKILIKSELNENGVHINNIEEVKNEILKKCTPIIKGVEITVE